MSNSHCMTCINAQDHLDQAWTCDMSQRDGRLGLAFGSNDDHRRPFSQCART